MIAYTYIFIPSLRNALTNPVRDRVLCFRYNPHLSAFRSLFIQWTPASITICPEDFVKGTNPPIKALHHGAMGKTVRFIKRENRQSKHSKERREIPVVHFTTENDAITYSSFLRTLIVHYEHARFHDSDAYSDLVSEAQGALCGPARRGR